MTFEEIKEMINSTIVENGERQITGKALNLALLEIITAMEENKPEGGAASEIVYFPDRNTGEMSAENLAHNLEVYNKFKAAFEAGEPLPLLSVDLAFMFAEMEGHPVKSSGYSLCLIVAFIPADSPMAEEMGNGIMFAEMEGSNNTVMGLIQPDGNVKILS